MQALPLSAPAKSHLLKVVNSLLAIGWNVERIPKGGKLLLNGQKILLKSDRLDLRLRLFMYKVTGSSRDRQEERRIEITSTYPNGLRRLKKFCDVVLGHDQEADLYVGVDPKRIEYGGKTANASSFFDKEGLSLKGRRTIPVLSRRAELFKEGIEYHAFINPTRLPEYLFNMREIHLGVYRGDGLYSGNEKFARKAAPKTPPKYQADGDILILTGPTSHRRAELSKIDKGLMKALEKGNLPKTRRKITPERFLKLKQVMEENGLLGEKHVLTAERSRLRRAKRPDLVRRISWVSQQSVSEGYDILSFETTGQERYIEVKSTVGTQNTFEMSDSEWQRACELEDKYVICRVVNVRGTPSRTYIRNPRMLEKEGKVQKTASGWRVSYRARART
jgi:hypothetical protein